MSSRPPIYWRLRPFIYRLEGSRCSVCGHFHPLNRVVCRRCGSRKLERDGLSSTGRLVNYTVVHQAQEGFEKTTPYLVGWVEMDDGTNLVGQLTDCDPQDLEVGMNVETVVRKLRVDGDSKLIVYAVKFRPVVQR
ncbi:MAG: Zn-ribbon domain-containing OB-fold protein [Candidatus Caldarchaeum sp.]|nr:Zn-ribbon domain-containing OB-fold protein [Candidatus Caldarchaeum sp.]